MIWLAFVLALVTGFQVLAEAPTRRVRLGIYDFPPLVSFGTHGNPQGLFIDVLKDIAKRQHWNLSYVKGEPDHLLQRLASADIDLLIVPDRGQRQDHAFRYSEERLITDWVQVYAPKNAPINTILDLDGRRIAVLEQGDYLQGEQAFDAMCEAFNVHCDKHHYPDYPAIFMAASRGEVDAVLINRLFGAAEAKRHALSPRPIMMAPTDIRVAVSQASPDAQSLQRQFDLQLLEMKRDRWSIYNKWQGFLFGKQVGDSLQLKTLFKWAGILMLAILVLFLLVYFLRSHLGRHTRALAHSEAQCRTLFEQASTPLLVCNGSQLIRRYKQQLKLGTTDFGAYFNDRPNELKKWLGEIRINKANAAALRLFEVTTCEELQRWLPSALPPSSLKAVRQFLSLQPQAEEFTREIPLVTPQRRMILAIVSFPIANRGKANYNVPVSITRAIHDPLNRALENNA